MTTPDRPIRIAITSWWTRHGGLDGGIRVLGAGAVILTIEALAGYFLWLGMTLHLHVPDQLGWTLQVGLAGGSAVGTRAFHRGQDGEWQFGLAASVAAVLFLLFDGSVAALLHYDQLHWNAGWLAVGVLSECLIVGYLTVHTLMARPRPAAVPATDTTPETTPVLEAWGGPETVTPPTVEREPVGPPTEPIPAPLHAVKPTEPQPPVKPAPSPHRPRSKAAVENVKGWQEWMAAVPRDADPTYKDPTRWLRARAKRVGVKQGQGNPALRRGVEAKELELARADKEDEDVETA